MCEVKLLGFWASPFSHRVIWALKLKGVSFEHREEDLPNKKSQLLLQYNPVHKKIPVLVHGGKPISESLVILEYIEEAWPHNPLLPKDAHERALARFWIQFSVEKKDVFLAFFHVFGDQEKEKAAKDIFEVLKVVEDQGLGEKKFFGGETIGLVDIVYGWLTYWFECMEEVIGLKVVEPNSLPRLHAWAENFKQFPLIKENLPVYEELFVYMKNSREKFVSNITYNHYI